MYAIPFTITGVFKMTVKELRQMGYTVKVRHNRLYEFGRIGYKSKGGLTEVNIYYGGALLAEGKARCSDNDNYDRKLGVAIALGRAIKYSDSSIYILDRLNTFEWQQEQEARLQNF